jgi:hypothetical protein
MRVLVFRGGLVEALSSIGEFLDGGITAVVGGLDVLATLLFDPIGYTLGDLYVLLGGVGGNPWDFIKATTPHIFEAIGTLVNLLWNAFLDWLGAKLTIVGAFLLEIAAAVLDPVGSFLGNIYVRLEGAGGNPWPWIRLSTPDIWTAFDSLFQAIWWAFQDWIVASLSAAGALFEGIWNAILDVGGGLLGLPADILEDILAKIDFLTEIAPFLAALLDNFWEFVFELFQDTFWPALERLLIKLWDGEVRST